MSRDPRCCEFRAALADALDTTSLPAHAQSCTQCRAELQAARRHAKALRALDRPKLPFALRAPSLPPQIPVRVSAQFERKWGPVLRRALGPPQAAFSIDLAEATRSHEAEGIRELEQQRTPGWLWSRIRRDLHYHAVARKRDRVQYRLVSLIAASVVLSTFLWTLWSSRQNRHSSPPVQYYPLAEPPVAGFSLDIFRRMDGSR
jgi:hypothetical protein